MNIFPRYAKLPVSTPVATLALFILMMVLWLQGGLTSIYQHLYLLIGSYLSWGILLPFLQGMVEVIKWKETKILLWGIFAVLQLIIIHFIISNIIYYSFQLLLIEGSTLPDLEEVKSFLFPSLLGRMVDFVMFFGLLSWVNQIKSLSENKVKLAQAEAQLQKSRLNTLKSQLNPHFLFNTLHAISSMIGFDDEKARDITIRISSLLRKTLKANEKTTHSLKDEFELVKEYLEIEAERFSDRLSIKNEIEDACLEITVPTMLLQPIIENAFKHGVALVEGESEVSIVVVSENGKVKIIITNDFDEKAKPLGHSTGIGLKNLDERLKLHYKDQYTFLYGIRDKQFYTTLILPKS